MKSSGKSFDVSNHLKDVFLIKKSVILKTFQRKFNTKDTAKMYALFNNYETTIDYL